MKYLKNAYFEQPDTDIQIKEILKKISGDIRITDLSGLIFELQKLFELGRGTLGAGPAGSNKPLFKITSHF
jgi:hypothetical protein